MRQLTLLLLCVCSMLYSHAQQRANVKGSIADTTDKSNLSNSTISLLRAKDSILYKFTRADKQGHFHFANVDTGKYVLLTTYPGYADYVDQLTITGSDINLGNISMVQKARLLQEVVVRQTVSAIKVKGDTTEFTADSFHVKENANVEDLLKKLPGIQVDSKGNITAQGEKVKKVLVDGEEFFGDDPTLVTQNLRADMIDKVQVYDKKSDQAAFTGVDDGQKDKTINLKLKEDKKRGYFGKLAAGAGLNGFHDNQAMFNKFRKKEKIAAYGIVSNTGTSGLGWRDRDNYGSGRDNMEYDDVSGFYYSSGSGDPLDSWNGSYNDAGLPLVQNGGLHYNNKWNDDKQSVNLNYKLSKLMVDNLETNNSKNILPGNVNYSNSRTSSAHSMTRNKGNGAYEVQLDSSSSVKITAEGSTAHKIAGNSSFTETLREDSSMLNNSTKRTTSTGDNKAFNSSILWKKKFNKKGRTISFNLKQNYTNDDYKGYLYAVNNFYTDTANPTQTITDQYKKNDSKNMQVSGKITYTEPITQYGTLVANYALAVSNSSSTQLSFNKNEGKYNQLDSTYSNDYDFNVLTNRGGLAYNYTRKKLRTFIGTDVGFTNFHQKDEMHGVSTERSFVNWYPQARIGYSFTNQRRLNLGYNGSTQQPTIQQIQPVKSNDNPLNIVAGNPDLKPAFRHNVNMNFFDYKVLSDRSIWMGANYSVTENAITNSTYTDSAGRTTTQAININGNKNYNAYLDYGFKWKKPDLYLGFRANVDGSRYVGIVNNLQNITNSNNYSGTFSTSKSKDKKYEVSLEATATYTNSTSSIQKDNTTKYWIYSIEQNSEVELPFKFTAHSSISYTIRQRTPEFSGSNNVFLWNAWLGKKLLKKDNLLIKISGNDLLNKNIGLTRTVNSNYISESRYQTIRRFFLLSIVWNFSNNGAGLAK
ncbi:outer membrane beta-barrel protein [Deminuibacter soli]|nr:outer membrane beta-barrel protein [Deminuibacter soli]